MSSVVLFSWSVAACGDIAVTSSAELGGEGDSCTSTPDCTSPLRCVGLVCTAPAATDGTADGATDATDATDGEPIAVPDPCGLGECPDELRGNGSCDPTCDCDATGLDNSDCAHACDNEADTLIHTGATFVTQPLGCWNGCAGNPELTACAATCIVEFGITQPCADCFSIAVDCTMTNCATDCADQEAQACFDCGEANCGLSFRTCSGLSESAVWAVP